jgi:O-antigen/teichoic acid export membrane protein
MPDGTTTPALHLAPKSHPATLALIQRAGATVLILQVAGAGIAYGQQVVLARVLGASPYGAYTYLYLGASFAALLAGLGMPAAAVRFLPAYTAAGDHTRAHAFTAVATRLTYSTATAAALAVGLVIVVLAITGVLAHPYSLLLALLLVPALAGSTLETELARARGRMSVAYLGPLILRPALIGLCVALLATQSSTSVTDAIAASALVAAAVLFAQHRLRTRTQASQASETITTDERRTWTSVGLSLLAVSALMIVLMQLDILIVGAIRGDRAAGTYAAASKTAMLVSFVILAVNAPAAAHFATLFHQGRTEELRHLVARLSALIFWPSLLIAVVLALLAVPILNLFGSGFADARVALLLLLAGQLINAAAGSVGYLLTVTGHHRHAAVALTASALAFLALTALGTALAGLDGAAAGSCLAFLLWNIALGWLVVRKLAIWPAVVPAPKALRSTLYG